MSGLAVGMTEREFLSLALGTPVLDDRGEVCIVIAKPGDHVTVAYGGGDERVFSARFDAFRYLAPGVFRWDGWRWTAEPG